MKILNKIAYIYLFVAFSLLLVGTRVHAEDSKAFSISPPNFEISASPGDVIKNTIKLENLSDSLLTLTVKGENFIAYGEGGQVNLTEEDSTYSINKWLSFSKTEFNIESHKTYLFEFTLNVPQNAEPGSHYGAVVFANSSPTTETGSVAKVIQEIGALVLIRIPGQISEEANLLSFSPETPYFTDPKVKLNALAENVGGIHIKMTPYINIYDLFGNKVKTIEADSHNILPGSKRLFTGESDFEGFGYFRATIEMVYSSGEKVLRSETNFYSLNLQRSVPITIGIVVVLGIYITFRKRINKAIKIIIKG